MKQKDFDESIFGIINPSVVCFQSHSYLIQLYHLSADDGSFYFDEKLVDAREHQGTLSTTSSVVRGFTAFASVTSGSINVSGSILVLQDFMLPIRTKKKKKNFRISPDASILGCRFLATKYWVWQNSSLALEFLAIPKTSSTK